MGAGRLSLTYRVERVNQPGPLLVPLLYRMLHGVRYCHWLHWFHGLAGTHLSPIINHLDPP